MLMAITTHWQLFYFTPFVKTSVYCTTNCTAKENTLAPNYLLCMCDCIEIYFSGVGLLGNFRAHSLAVRLGGGGGSNHRGSATWVSWRYIVLLRLHSSLWLSFLFMCFFGFCCKRAFLFNKVILSLFLPSNPSPFLLFSFCLCLSFALSVLLSLSRSPCLTLLLLLCISCLAVLWSLCIFWK